MPERIYRTSTNKNNSKDELWLSDPSREHMAGDIPGQSVKGYGKREKYKGCD
jgi:hypothetical protein